jgi:predicted transcriptional regulator
MTRRTEIDEDKLSEVALAILSLTAHEEFGVTRAWKGLDWALLNNLHQRGWIENPVGKQKSVVFTQKGEALASEFLSRHFGK